MSDSTAEVEVELPDFDGGSGRLAAVSGRTWGFLAALLGLVGAFVYDYAVLDVRDPVVFGLDPALHEWAFVLSLVVFLFYVVVPLATDRSLTRRYWRRLRAHPVGLASFLYLVVFFFVGMVGPALVGYPGQSSNPSYQPPYGFTVTEPCFSDCGDNVVRGTLAHPLGTNGNGHDMVTVVVHGARIALEVAFVSATLLVPLATAVGTVAAEFGGWVDDLLMRYVDLQQVIPAFFVYIVAQYVYGPTLLLMLLVFGVLSWGSIARMVRSEAVQTREAEFVRAARSAGAGRLWVVRRHIVPNVTNTVIASVTLLIPNLVLVEAALSYLALGDPSVNSLGYAISGSLNDAEFPIYWWASTVPLVVLVVTIVALNLFGDALRDVLDPRMEA